MKYYVNENCIGCGLCATLCPAIFEMSESGKARANDTAAESGEGDEAMESCPVNAIEKK